MQEALSQAAAAACGCGRRAAGPTEILSSPAAEIVIPELSLVDREPAYRRFGDGIGGRSGAPWLIEAESAVMIMPATGDSGSGTAKPSSLRSESTSPGNYNDANGNGQWDEGEEIFIDGDSSREVDDGGGSVEVGGDPTLGGGDTGTGGGGWGDPSEPLEEKPPCEKSNPVEWLNPPDGAKYYVPEKVDNAFINKIADHVTSFRNTYSYIDMVYEIQRMYTDPSYEFFVDFKDFGTPLGPSGSESAGTVTYYSEAAGQFITASAFEAFGNFFFGYIMTIAGFAPEETQFYAGWAQSGESGLFRQDAPEDKPHVDYGIAVAQSYLAMGQTQSVMNVKTGSC